MEIEFYRKNLNKENRDVFTSCTKLWRCPGEDGKEKASKNLTIVGSGIVQSIALLIEIVILVVVISRAQEMR